MTEKTLKQKIEGLGGSVDLPAWLVTFPQTLQIKTQSQAVDLLDVLIHGKEAAFNSFDIPLNAIKAFINRTPQGDTAPETEQETAEPEPLHLFDMNPAGLHDLFREYDEAMEKRASA